MVAEEFYAYFAVLELPADSSLETVKSTYRELVKVWHPDRFTDSPSLQRRAEEKLKAINLAYGAILEAFQTGGLKTPAPIHPKPTPKAAPVNDRLAFLNTSLTDIREGRTTDKQRQVYLAAVDAYGGHDSLAAAVLPVLIESARVRVQGSAKKQFGGFFRDVRIAQFGVRDKSEYPAIIARWIIDNAAVTPEYERQRAAFVALANE